MALGQCGAAVGAELLNIRLISRRINCGAAVTNSIGEPAPFDPPRPSSDKKPDKSMGCAATLAACGVTAEEADADTAAARDEAAACPVVPPSRSESDAPSLIDSVPASDVGSLRGRGADPPEGRADEPERCRLGRASLVRRCA